MRLFFAIIVVAAIGYLGWVFYRQDRERGAARNGRLALPQDGLEARVPGLLLQSIERLNERDTGAQ